MRKVDMEVAWRVREALASKEEGWHRKPAYNTEVDFENGAVEVWVHGNKIFEFPPGGPARIRTRGWHTNLTRDRLNAVLFAVGLKSRVYKKEGTLFLNGREVPNDEWMEVSE